MWCLETIKLINAKATELALAGCSERDCLEEAGIRVPFSVRLPKIREGTEISKDGMTTLRGQKAKVSAPMM